MKRTFDCLTVAFDRLKRNELFISRVLEYEVLLSLVLHFNTRLVNCLFCFNLLKATIRSSKAHLTNKICSWRMCILIKYCLNQ